MLDKYGSSHPEVFCKKDDLENFANFTGKKPVLESLQPQACNFIKKETLAHIFSYDFFKIFKNNFFHRTLRVAAFADNIKNPFTFM